MGSHLLLGVGPLAQPTLPKGLVCLKLRLPCLLGWIHQIQTRGFSCCSEAPRVCLPLGAGVSMQAPKSTLRSEPLALESGASCAKGFS